MKGFKGVGLWTLASDESRFKVGLDGSPWAWEHATVKGCKAVCLGCVASSESHFGGGPDGASRAWAGV